jgi:hypothetical protein
MSVDLNIRWSGAAIRVGRSVGRRVLFGCGCECLERPDREDPGIAATTDRHWCSDEHEAWAVTEDADGWVHVTELGLCAGRASGRAADIGEPVS